MESNRTHRGAVLVVDDNQFFLRMQQMLLERAGFEVLTAENGAEAFELVTAGGRQVDAVVTDLMMPRMDGKELCRRLRSNGTTIPVILVTGSGDNECADAPASFGFTAAIKKPFDPKDLIEMVSLLIPVRSITADMHRDRAVNRRAGTPLP